MIRTTLLTWIFLGFSVSWTGLAQELAPVLLLSPEESAQARQGAHTLGQARDRNHQAELAWRSFQETYQAAHPSLPNLHFTADFRLAFVRQEVPIPGPYAISAVELSAGEQRQGQAVYREWIDSREALRQAEQHWKQIQYQLIAAHVPPSSGGGQLVTLPGGQQRTIPSPWQSGVMFTPDFRFGVPLGY